MAVSPINLCADLQAWRSAGLSFLYFPDAEVQALLNLPGAGISARQQGEARSPRQVASERISSDRQVQVQKNSEIASKGSLASGGLSSGPVGLKQSPVQTHKPSEAQRSLPEAWLALSAKIRPAPVVWTYLELGEDLLVKGNPERSKALKELIGSLGLKGGTSSFLPVVLPGREQDGSDAWCFEQVFSKINGRILVSLGTEALALGPYSNLGLRPFQEKIVQGRIILCLPAFEEIISNAGRFEATKVFLRTAFAKINIL